MKKIRLTSPPAVDTLNRFAVLLLFALLAVSLWPATLDDSFISYRYARNWVEGHGLVFNPGERVEGYSNLLWVLLLAPFLALGLDIETISKLLGVLCGMGVLLIAMELLRRHFHASRTTVLLMGAWLASQIGFVYYAISGLETLFYTLQVVLLIHLLLHRRCGWAALVSATLLITRPEGMLFILPLALSAWQACRHGRNGQLALGTGFFHGGKPRQERTAPWWFFPAMPLFSLGLVTLWRWSYYGALLPNTFNAKIKTHWGVIHYILWHSQTFINYAYKSFAWNEWVLILAAFYGLFLLRRRDLAPAAVLGCLLFFIWFSGSDWMSFGRFYVPALPVLGLFAWAGLERVISALARLRIRGMRVWIWLSLPILFNLITFYYADEELTSGTAINPAMHSRPHRAIGLWLKDHARPGDTLVVNEIGAIGWYSGLPVIDMIGLTDRTIPRFWKNGNFAEYAGYILAQNPRFIALNDRQSPADEGMDPVHHALYERMQTAGGYRLLHTFSLTRGKNLLLFERRGP
jgi:hypothetical protein